MIVGTTNAPLPTTAAFRMKSRRPLVSAASEALALSLELAIPGLLVHLIGGLSRTSRDRVG
jgi:hypothetical protein